MSKEDWIVELTESDSDMWCDDIECDSREEAIAKGMKEAIEEGLESFRIGRREKCELSGIDAETIIENARYKLADEVGEVSEGYLDEVTEDQEKELEEKLNEVFWEWHKRHKLFPDYCRILEDEVIKVSGKTEVRND